MTDDTNEIVVVDRITDTLPDYCIHGETWCQRCRHAVWLGSETMQVVIDGAYPVCLDCMNELYDAGLLPDGPTGHLHDHQRGDPGEH